MFSFLKLVVNIKSFEVLACVFILILNEGFYKITKTNFNKIKLDSLSLFLLVL